MRSLMIVLVNKSYILPMRKRNWSCYPAARGKSQSTRTKAAEGQRILLDQHD